VTETDSPVEKRLVTETDSPVEKRLVTDLPVVKKKRGNNIDDKNVYDKILKWKTK